MGGTGARIAGLALAWLAGVATHLQERSLWPVAAYAGIAIVGLGALLAPPVWRHAFQQTHAWAVTLLLAAAAACGFGASGLRAALRMADVLDPALENRDLVVIGIVSSLPQRGPTGLRFRFDVESARDASGPVPVPPQLALGWYAGSHEDAALAGPEQELRAGERWRWTVRLRRPHGNVNPASYDWELSLLEQGVRATGYVRDAPAERLAEAAGDPIDRLRQRVRDAIEATVPDRRVAGVLAALCIGDQGAIEREDWDLFRNTGTAHLMAISGLHVTMLAWAAGLGIAVLWRRSARATLWLPAPLAGRLGGMFTALAYALFSGWGVPSQRTVWMLATVTLLRVLGLRWPWLLVLLAAAVIVTMLDPWALLQAGFWLSFMAVGLLMASSPADDRTRDPPATDAASATRWHRLARGAWRQVRHDLRTQAIATLGLTPLTLVFFHQVSLLGFAANVVAIPLVTLVVTPLALLGTLIVPLWTLGAIVVRGLMAVLSALAGLPAAVWTAPVAPAWAQLAGLLGAVLMVLPIPWRVRALGAVLVVPLLWPGRALPPPGTFELIALDVGQGTSVLVRTHAHLLVYDAGPQYARDNDAGQRILAPVLRARGEARVDRLVLSHRDGDHTGGARSLIGAYPVDALLTSLEDGHPLLTLGPPVERCVAGQSWTWDDVRFDVLHPGRDRYEVARKSNALSCVVRVTGSNGSALLTGDIERGQEAQLVASLGTALRSDVLIVPHHGSRTSSTPAFIDAVRPTVAVFQAGYLSRFRHPAPDVVARYVERGIETVTSPACGAWHGPPGTHPEAACERERVRRYWHHRMR